MARLFFTALFKTCQLLFLIFPSEAVIKQLLLDILCSSDLNWRMTMYIYFKYIYILGIIDGLSALLTDR